MLTASKDCNLDWKVQYTKYFNISKDDIDVLFRSDTVPYAVYKNLYWYPGFEIYFNKSFFIEFM